MLLLFGELIGKVGGQEVEQANMFHQRSFKSVKGERFKINSYCRVPQNLVKPQNPKTPDFENIEWLNISVDNSHRVEDSLLVEPADIVESADIVEPADIVENADIVEKFHLFEKADTDRSSGGLQSSGMDHSAIKLNLGSSIIIL